LNRDLEATGLHGPVAPDEANLTDLPDFKYEPWPAHLDWKTLTGVDGVPGITTVERLATDADIRGEIGIVEILTGDAIGELTIITMNHWKASPKDVRRVEAGMWARATDSEVCERLMMGHLMNSPSWFACYCFECREGSYTDKPAKFCPQCGRRAD